MSWYRGIHKVIMHYCAYKNTWELSLGQTIFFVTTINKSGCCSDNSYLIIKSQIVNAKNNLV